MPLNNYTTEVSAKQSVAEIQELLTTKGATTIMIEYQGRGEPVGIAFQIELRGNILRYRLPCRVGKVEALLWQQWESGEIERRKYTGREHAYNVAWRNLRDWVKAQMAAVETEMVEMAEVFMPYMLLSNNQTMYEQMQHKLLPGDTHA